MYRAGWLGLSHRDKNVRGKVHSWILGLQVTLVKPHIYVKNNPIGGTWQDVGTPVCTGEISHGDTIALNDIYSCWIVVTSGYIGEILH